jgi:hypothetical protein
MYVPVTWSPTYLPTRTHAFPAASVSFTHADVFSFGMLVWQLVTSEPIPYGKLSVPQILLGVSQGTVRVVS